MRCRSGISTGILQNHSSINHTYGYMKWVRIRIESKYKHDNIKKIYFRSALEKTIYNEIIL